MNAKLDTEQSTKKSAKYAIDIEGAIYDWDDPTITVPQLRALGGLPTGVPVLEIDLKTNKERTLVETDVVHLKPGLGFSKKVEFRRG
jgi:Multiubiquitin